MQSPKQSAFNLFQVAKALYSYAKEPLYENKIRSSIHKNQQISLQYNYEYASNNHRFTGIDTVTTTQFIETRWKLSNFVIIIYNIAKNTSVITKQIFNQHAYRLRPFAFILSLVIFCIRFIVALFLVPFLVYTANPSPYTEASISQDDGWGMD